MRIANRLRPTTAVAEVDDLRERAAAQLLDERDHDVAAVERQHRDQVQHAEREADLGRARERSHERRPSRHAAADTRTMPTELDTWFVSRAGEDVRHADDGVAHVRTT